MTFSNKNKTYYWIILLYFNSLVFSYGQKSIDYRRGFGMSNRRTVNINTPRGMKYQHNKRAAVYTVRLKGNNICSGVLLNTVNQDGGLYYMTAEHCLPELISDDNNDEFIFHLSFDREALPPSFRTRTQSPEDAKVYLVEGELLVADMETDLALIRLSNLPVQVDLENVYYAGWNLDKSATNVALIGHPRGDLKKIYELSNFSNRFGFGLAHQFFGEVKTEVPVITFKYCDLPNDLVIQIEKGASGSGLLDSNNRVTSLFIGGEDDLTPPVLDLFTPLWTSWIERSNLYNDEYIYYSFPKKEVPSLQKYLDPDSTYVSKVPGGYGFSSGSTFKIDTDNFNLNLEGGQSFSTPEFGPGNSTDDMIKLNIWELLKKDSKDNSQLDVLRKAGIYSLHETANLSLKIWVFPNNNIESKTLLLQTSTTSEASDQDMEQGHFKNYINSSMSRRQIITLGKSLDIKDIKDIKPFEYKLPVVIEILNNGSNISSVRGLRIPGLGYRNAVELFQPDEFNDLYKNKDLSYPDSYGSTGTATVTLNKRNENPFSNTIQGAILLATEITPSSEVSNSSNPSSSVFSYKFITEDNGGYINLLQHTLRFEAKKTVKITYKTKTIGDQKHVGAWIDYNKSRSFEEGERVVSYNNINEADIETSFTVPDISGITTRMRLGYRIGSDLPAFADQNFTNGEMEDYSVHIYKNTKTTLLNKIRFWINPINIVGADFLLHYGLISTPSTQVPNRCLEISPVQGTSSQVADTSLSFTNFVDPSGGYNTNSCQTLKITPHPEAATNGLYALSFGRAENTRYIAIDLNREREPTPFLEDTLLSYGLTAIKSDTPNYLQISRLNSDTSKLVFKHAQYDAYSFSYTLTPTYQYNSPIDELENSIAQSHNNTTIVNKAAAIGGTVGTTVVGVAAVGVYAYKSINQTVASAEEQIPLTRSGEVVSEVRQGVFQRVKNFFVRAYKYCTGKLD